MKSNIMAILIGATILALGGLVVFITVNKKKDFSDDSSFSEEKWNKMIDLWVDGELDNPIKDVLTYDAEVNNGGHLQFFENCNDELEEMMFSLKESLPRDVYDNLKQAYDIYKSMDTNIENVDEYVDVALQGDLDKYDHFYYENYDKVKGILKEYASTIEISEQ